MHDNPALLEGVKDASAVYPLYVLNPLCIKPEKIGASRIRVSSLFLFLNANSFTDVLLVL